MKFQVNKRGLIEGIFKLIIVFLLFFIVQNQHDREQQEEFIGHQRKLSYLQLIKHQQNQKQKPESLPQQNLPKQVLPQSSLKKIVSRQKIASKILNVQNQKLTIPDSSKQNGHQSISNLLTLNTDSLNTYLKQFDHLVIYFHQAECEYCLEFEETYKAVAKKFGQQNQSAKTQIRFGKLQLNPNTEHLFKSLAIQSVPQVKFFYKSKVQNYSLSFNQYGEQMIHYIAEWIKRIKEVSVFQATIEQKRHQHSLKSGHSNSSLFIPQIASLQSLILSEYTRVFISNCSYQEKSQQNEQLTRFLKKTYTQQLYYDFYCTRNETITKHYNRQTSVLNQILMQVYEFSEPLEKYDLISTIQLEQDVKFQPKVVNVKSIYELNFDRYLFKQVKKWDPTAIISIFTERNPGFLLIVNNQTKSKSALMSYKQIKQQFILDREMPAVQFYWADLSNDVQQTTRIKRYLTGLLASSQQYYPYPILSYLRDVGGYLKKYLFPIEEQFSHYKMNQWITKIIDIEQRVLKPQHQQTNNHQYSKNEAQSHEEVHSIQEEHDFKQDQQISNSNQPQTTMLQQSQPFQVQQYFRSAPQAFFPQRYIKHFASLFYNDSIKQQQKQKILKMPESFTKLKRKVKLISFYDFRILLSSLYKRQFFVFINWKNDLACFQLHRQLSHWWETQYDQQESQEQEVQSSEYDSKMQMIQNTKHNQEHDLNKKQIQQKKAASNGQNKKEQPQIVPNKLTDTNKPKNTNRPTDTTNQPIDTTSKPTGATNKSKDATNKTPTDANTHISIDKQVQKQNVMQNKQTTRILQEIALDKSNIQKTQKVGQMVKKPNEPQHKVQSSFQQKESGQESNQQIQEQQNTVYKQFSSMVNTYSLNLNNNDYPPIYKDVKGKIHHLHIQYAPTILYFSEDKTQMAMIEGVQTLQQIKEFMLKHLILRENKENLQINRQQTNSNQNPSDYISVQKLKINKQHGKDNEKQHVRILDQPRPQQSLQKDNHQQIKTDRKQGQRENIYDRELLGLHM